MATKYRLREQFQKQETVTDTYWYVERHMFLLGWHNPFYGDAFRYDTAKAKLAGLIEDEKRVARTVKRHAAFKERILIPPLPEKEPNGNT